jgi:hypothetical protein
MAEAFLLFGGGTADALRKIKISRANRTASLHGVFWTHAAVRVR